MRGVELIHTQFWWYFGRAGIEEVAGQGEYYDPELAEAVAVTEVSESAKDNLILEVVRKGYRLNGKLVRPARVRRSDRSGISGQWSHGPPALAGVTGPGMSGQIKYSCLYHYLVIDKMNR